MDIPEGFIPLPSHVEPQATFRPLLDDLRRTLTRPPFERTLHSVCLYGSVARDEANAGHSDFDLTLVLRDPSGPEPAAQLETTRLALQARHPEVNRIDFDTGHLDQACDPANHDSWGYWLKHRCRCLWGENLTGTLPSLRPAKAITLALNGDYTQVLEGYMRRLESASPEEEHRRLQRRATKKLIRSSDVLHGETESAWPETLEHYLTLFRMRRPGQAPTLECFKAVLDGQVTDPAVFIKCLRAFGAWIQCQAQPAEMVVLSVRPAGPWHPVPCACTGASG